MRDWRAFVREHLELIELDRQREERIIEELAMQLEDLYQEARGHGLSPQEADQSTRSQVPDWAAFSQSLSQAEFPNRRPAIEISLQASEENLRQRGGLGQMLAQLLHDIRLTFRSIRFRPAFWALTVLMLGLGIGATTTIFSVVNGVLLAKLPYPEPERLVYFMNPAFSTPRFVDWQEHSTSFEQLAGVRSINADYTGGNQPLALCGGLVTPGYFELFRAQPALGRLFTDEDFSGPATRAILGYGAWQRLFGGDSAIIGRTITINGEPREVVGVLERCFTSVRGFSGQELDVWLAMDPRWERFFDPGKQILSVFGRTRPGLSVAAAEEELNQKIAVLAKLKPSIHASAEGEPCLVDLAPLQVALTGDIRTNLFMLLGAVTMLLLIATANVANIVLARGIERISEVGIRSAMGASRARLISQLLTESTILALAGGLAGVGLAWAGVRAFAILDPGNIPLIHRITVDWRVLGFALGVSLLTGLLFASIPAIRVARMEISNMTRALRGGEHRDRGWLRNILLTTEIALALILLSGAGLLFNSLIRLQSVDPGFEPTRLVAIELNVRGPEYDEESLLGFTRRVDERLEALPGVEGAATTITVPFQSWDSWRRGWQRRHWEIPGGEQREIRAMVHPATADYFSLLGVDLRGRTFTAADLAARPVPAIVSDTFAQQIFPGEDALGRIIYGKGWDEEERTELYIIGIVSNLHDWRLDQGSGRTVFVPWQQYGAANPFASILVKTRQDPGPMIEDLREAIWAEAPDMPLPNVFVMEQQIAESLTVPRFYSALLSVFAIVALMLTTGGIFASMLYSVGRRRQEFSIRTALGADPTDLILLVLRRTGSVTAIGVILGAAGAWGLTRFLESMLFGVTATDPRTFVTMALLITVAALIASWLPAHKAAMIDPMVVLRRE